MKNKYLLLYIIVFLLIDCSNSDDSNTPEEETTEVINVTLFQFSQTQNVITFTYDADVDASQFQLSYQVNQEGAVPSQGTIKNLTPNSPKSFSLNELSINIGDTYILYLKAINIDSAASNWSQPQLFTASDFCLVPENLETTFNNDEIFGVQWSSTGDNTVTESYEVKYDLQGFDITNNEIGTSIITSELFTYDFELADNETYDIYLRTLCNNDSEFSEWIGPVSYQNLLPICPLPYFLNIIDEDMTNIGLEWNEPDPNPEVESYEVKYGLTGFNVLEVDIGTSIITNEASTHDFELTSYQAYDFYVRTLCDNSAEFSEWAGPITYQYLPLTCNRPYSLVINDNDATNIGLVWSDPDLNTNPDIEGYEVRYDMQGFDIFDDDIGTSIITTELYTYDFDFSGNETYDIYIRTLCGNEFEFSEWIGPVTYTYELPYCPLPNINIYTTNHGHPTFNSEYLVLEFERAGFAVRFKVVPSGFSVASNAISEFLIPPNGDSGWEVTFMGSSYGNTFEIGQSYDIYVRQECTPQNISEWLGPTTIIWQ